MANRQERLAVINRVRRKLTYAPNKSTYLKIRGDELIALYDELGDLGAELSAAEEREATAVRRQAEAEAATADALADTVVAPAATKAKTRKATGPVEVPPVYPAIIRAAAEINAEYSECWQQPLPEALKQWADYNQGALPDGWETILADILAV